MAWAKVARFYWFMQPRASCVGFVASGTTTEIHFTARSCHCQNGKDTPVLLDLSILLHDAVKPCFCKYVSQCLTSHICFGARFFMHIFIIMTVQAAIRSGPRAHTSQLLLPHNLHTNVGDNFGCYLPFGPRLLLGEVVDVTVGALAIKARLGAFPTQNKHGTPCGPLWSEKACLKSL